VLLPRLANASAWLAGTSLRMARPAPCRAGTLGWCGRGGAETAYPLAAGTHRPRFPCRPRDLATELMGSTSCPICSSPRWPALPGRSHYRARKPGLCTQPTASLNRRPADQGTESAVRWVGRWKLLHLSLQDVQVVGLARTRRTRWSSRPGPAGCTVSRQRRDDSLRLAGLRRPPTLLLAAHQREITWRMTSDGGRYHADDYSKRSTPVRSTSGRTCRAQCSARSSDSRGPLGRGLRRPIVIAEGLTVTYKPRRACLLAPGGQATSPLTAATAPLCPAVAPLCAGRRASCRVQKRPPSQSHW